MPETTQLTISCTSCNQTVSTRPTTNGDPSLPKNWKRFANQVFCASCVAKHYVPRGAWLPVCSVVEGYDVADWTDALREAGWKSLRLALNKSWTTAARLYNWAVVEFAKTDTAPLIPNRQETGLLPPRWDRAAAVRLVRSLVETRWPNINSLIDSQSKYVVLAQAEKAYFQNRFERLVLCREVLPQTHAGKMPLPIPIDSVRCIDIANGTVQVALRISGSRFTLKCQAGHRFRRQARQIKQCLDGGGRIGELKIQKRQKDIMIGFSLLLPREYNNRTEAIMKIVTQQNRLFTITVNDREEPWYLNDDSIKQCLTGYRSRLNRISEDMKMERRRPHQHSRSFDEARAEMAVKYTARLSTYCHKVASIIAGLARRNHVCKVEYDDREHSWFGDQFQWFKLRSLIAEKIAQFGVEFVHVGSSDENQGE